MFLLTFLTAYVLLNVLVGVVLVDWVHPMGVVYFLILQWLDIGVAYSFTEFLFTMFLKPRDLPHLSHLNTSPHVALLYTTCNDAIAEVVAKLAEQRYAHCDVFILDDSHDDRFIKLIDDLATTGDYRIVRRASRGGFKAGNLNNWLRLFGPHYDYFIVLDSDSLVEPDFVERMLKYAEHPENHDVAIFQSKIVPWNTTSGFIPKTIYEISPLWLYQWDRLFNQCEFLAAWGHNNLCRTSALLEVNGFDESFIAEDYATALKLWETGFRSKLVNVISYEGIPETVEHFTKRTRRWAHQTLQLEFCRHGAGNVPLITKLHLFINTYRYLSWFIYTPAMVLAVWGYKSDAVDAYALGALILTGGILSTPLLWPLATILFYVAILAVLRLPLAMYLRISPKAYWRHLFLAWVLDFYAMFSVIRASVQFFLGVQPEFTVTPKQRSGSSVQAFAKGIAPVMIFVVVLTAGLVQNPVSLIFNFPWLLPLLATPAVIGALVMQETRGRFSVNSDS